MKQKGRETKKQKKPQLITSNLIPTHLHKPKVGGLKRRQRMAIEYNDLSYRIIAVQN